MRWLCFSALIVFISHQALARTECEWVQYEVWDADTATLYARGYYYCWTVYEEPPPVTEPKGGGYPGEGPLEDTNNNGIIDDWSIVLETADPCAYNLDWGDRLGSEWGGPNAEDGAPAGETGRPHHNGVDMQGDLGDPIRSIMTGTVERADDDGSGCGLSVRVRNADGSSATYCHMSGIAGAISAGTQVSAGDVLGQVGDTGSPDAGAYHLHLIFRDSAGAYQEFFNYVDTPAQSSQLDPTGC